MHQVEARRAAAGMALHCPVCGATGQAGGTTWVHDMNEFVIRHAHGLEDEGLAGITDAGP